MIVVLLVVFVFAAYNGLVRLRNQVDNAWSQIDVQLKRRHDLIPNLVETVKGYAAHEKATLEAVIAGPQRRDRRAGHAGRAGRRPRTCSPARCSQLFALAEAYPDLKANQNFLTLQEELTATEDRIAYARQFYNDSVLKLQHQDPDVPDGRLRRDVQLQASASSSRPRRRRPRCPRSSSDPLRRVASDMFEQIGANKRRSVVLIAGFVVARWSPSAPSSAAHRLRRRPAS